MLGFVESWLMIEYNIYIYMKGQSIQTEISDQWLRCWGFQQRDLPDRVTILPSYTVHVQIKNITPPLKVLHPGTPFGKYLLWPQYIFCPLGATMRLLLAMLSLWNLRSVCGDVITLTALCVACRHACDAVAMPGSPLGLGRYEAWGGILPRLDAAL